MIAEDATDNDRRCDRLATDLEREMRRLSDHGMERGYTWSPILCPVIWTSLLRTTNARVLTVYRSWHLDEVRAAIRDFMSQYEVHTPLQLIGWLRLNEGEIRPRVGGTRAAVQRDLQSLTKYGYLKDYLQEYIMGKSRCGQLLQKKGCL